MCQILPVSTIKKKFSELFTVISQLSLIQYNRNSILYLRFTAINLIIIIKFNYCNVDLQVHQCCFVEIPIAK